jgi:MYXO-CTERM domain-containing protein
MRLKACWVGIVIMSAPALADVHQVPNANGPLAGKTIVVSPGHGKMLDGGSWRYQRGVTHDMREDVHTNEIVEGYLLRYLANVGARVESCRERSYQIHEVIVDNGGAGYTETGTWTASTSAPDYYGASYRYAWSQPTANATATFRPNLPASGRYPVYVWFTTGSNRTAEAAFAVHHTGGVSAVRIDQRQLGNSWVFLGDFHFAAGTAGAVVLSNQGSNGNAAVIADAVRFGGGVGTSGEPRWREGAQAFLAHKGFRSSRGDVTIRPAYGVWLAGGDTTRWRDDFLYVALHTNASSGTARGYSTFSYSNGRTPSWGSAGTAHYPTSPSPLTAASDRLRDAIHAEVLGDVRALHEPAWPDRRTHVMNFGELREARSFPSALLELGFHDNVDDAALLGDAGFRATAARAIYKGILRYWRGAGATVVPLPPTGLALKNQGNGRLQVSWTPVNDPLEPSAGATSFKVYVSPDGRGFDDGVVVQGTSHMLDGLASGQRVFVRVAALNAGGESLLSGVGAAQVGDGGPALVVDGFDRQYRHVHDNVEGRYTQDYAVEHVLALGRAAPTAGIDYAANEAVAGGQVQLAGYELVDWLLGEESSVDRTFDPTEQSLVERYLAAGGALLASGSEIGWDLVARGGGTRFCQEVLGVDYLSDDSGSRVVRGQPGSALAALGATALHDGSRGRYAVETPDVLAPRLKGSQALLAWEISGAPAAAVAQTQPNRVVVLGFPLESVVDDTLRADMTTRLVSVLVPNGLTPGTTSGGGGTTGTNGTGTTGGGATPAGSPTHTAAAPAPRKRSGGGCALTPSGPSDGSTPLPLALLLALLLVVRRRGRA